MAQDFQRHARGQNAPEVDQNLLVDALSASLVKMMQQNAVPQYMDDDEDGELSVDLLELMFHILSKIKYVILAMVLGALLAGGYAFFLKTPVYQATAKLYIMNQDGLSIDMSALNIGKALTMDYQEVFKTWEVHEMVRGMLQLDYSYTQMQKMLTVSNPSDTRLMYITVKNTDPQLATDMANAYATAAKTFIYQTMETIEPNEFSIALVPSAATGMSKSHYVVLGGVGGALAVIVLLVLLFLLDDRPQTPDDITKVAGIPTLAIVPRETTIAKSRKRVSKGRKRDSRRRKEGKA